MRSTTKAPWNIAFQFYNTGDQQLYEEKEYALRIYLSGVGEFADAALLARLAREAEESGWEGVFIWDHIRNHLQPPTRGWRWLPWR